MTGKSASFAVCAAAQGCDLFLEFREQRHWIRRRSQDTNALQWLIGLLSDKRIITLPGREQNKTSSPGNQGPSKIKQVLMAIGIGHSALPALLATHALGST